MRELFVTNNQYYNYYFSVVSACTTQEIVP